MSKQVAKVLKNARQRIVKQGWCQGHGSYTTETCAWIAIRAACNGSSTNAERALASIVAPGSTNVVDDIINWNDQRGRTKRQVLGAFTRAINAELKSK